MVTVIIWGADSRWRPLVLEHLLETGITALPSTWRIQCFMQQPALQRLSEAAWLEG